MSECIDFWAFLTCGKSLKNKNREKSLPSTISKTKGYFNFSQKLANYGELCENIQLLCFWWFIARHFISFVGFGIFVQQGKQEGSNVYMNLQTL